MAHPAPFTLTLGFNGTEIIIGCLDADASTDSTTQVLTLGRYALTAPPNPLPADQFVAIFVPDTAGTVSVTAVSSQVYGESPVGWSANGRLFESPSGKFTWSETFTLTVSGSNATGSFSGTRNIKIKQKGGGGDGRVAPPTA
ncbi:hypothetical protein OV090_12500 [Nannocystis sp. RBIL2]|uniref:hypothetical protein n=1 Tax=Nannocystis sp. RBIL2 TaxID=2996788 RepID=UPI0022700840|nr:hypothetical protein [Nannocystis sp. RBIL2]MCY1065592.1 hypothetical protein [Nannocystis sp. RBIL2]